MITINYVLTCFETAQTQTLLVLNKKFHILLMENLKSFKVKKDILIL